MSARIRYTSTEKEEILESKKIYTSSINGARYKVFLDLSNFTFRVRNELTKTNTSTGGENINNLNVLKRAAKRELERLGVRFEDEQRQRTFGLCEKGYNQQKHLSK